MVFVRVQEDVIHDLIEYMIPVTRTYFSVRVGDFDNCWELFLYKTYYKHLLYYDEVCHYRWCLKTDDSSNPLLIELQPNISLSHDHIYYMNPHPKSVKEFLQKEEYKAMNMHPKIIEKYIERGHIEYSFSENPCDLAVDYLLKNPVSIYWCDFLQKTNPRTVDYCIRMWDDEIPEEVEKYFSANQSQKAMDWLVNNPQFIDCDYIEENPFNYSYNRLKYVQSKRTLFNDVRVNP